MTPNEPIMSIAPRGNYPASHPFIYSCSKCLLRIILGLGQLWDLGMLSTGDFSLTELML